MVVLFVAATIILFLTIDWFILRMKKQRVPVMLTVHKPAHADAMPVRVPEGIFFARSHTWLNLYPSGKVRLGVDDFVSRLFVRPEIVLLKHQGEQVQKGEPILQLKQNGHTLTVRSPIGGDILAVNSELPANPSLLEEKLFSDGWGYLLRPKAVGDVRNLLLGKETREWIRVEFGRLRDLLANLSHSGATSPAFLQDGGAPISGFMESLDDKVWKEFEEEFLKIQ